MQKQFITVDGQCVHMRIAGEGPPMLLLHASPSSSKMMIPLMGQLSSHFQVIAPDTPGYGLSQPLTLDLKEMKDYAAFLHKVLDQLGLKKISLYGSATGAQIAIRFALMYPERIEHLYLDNSAHFTESQRNNILEKYFPVLEPSHDGSHLLKLWTMVRDMFVFFPWCEAKEAFRLQSPFPPVNVLHAVSMDFLQASGEYSRAYQAAFHHEQAQYVQALKVPTTIFDWEGSIVKPYIDQLLDFDFADNIKVLRIPPNPQNRTELMSEEMRRHRVGDTVALTKSKYELHRQGYVSTANGDLHLLADLSGEGKTILGIHSLRSSAAVAFQQLKSFTPDRPVVSISLPSHGDSDGMGIPFEVEALAELLHAGMKDLNIQDYEIAAFGEGTSIADAMSNQFQLNRLELPSTMERKELFPLEPDEYGTHLMKGWFFLRDRMLFTEPEAKIPANIRKPLPEINAAMIQLELLEWLKCRL